MVQVTAIKPDQEVHLATLTTQTSPLWGLSAISHANPPVSNADYIYDDSAGEGVFSYVFDSGILLKYINFEGRTELGVNTTGGAVTDRTYGTYVTSTVGGREYSVAKKTKLIDAQLTGSTKAIIDAGIPVVTAASNANQDANKYSPANLPEAIPVAASNSQYRRWFASN
ncbi:peptidase S8/S53 domain-containing protein [Plectosphaerella plurivora]|uniref:Peptidase S8/S53 domain-containing protein n=1 Tax=Plectosphaerella plurivora TaxID=936078 RepID=A0A9P9AEP4_9PEZI|nr:peptidase S8/S53 domain-containing protein [Plectosphaerella plurivora]